AWPDERGIGGRMLVDWVAGWRGMRNQPIRVPTEPSRITNSTLSIKQSLIHACQKAVYMNAVNVTYSQLKGDTK
ncbi:hypothetical protein, partial [Pseudomonas syringae]